MNLLKAFTLLVLVFSSLNALAQLRYQAGDRIRGIDPTLNFEVTKKLGAGGVGVTYEVVNPITGEHLALKILSRSEAFILENNRRSLTLRNHSILTPESILEIADPNPGRFFAILQPLAQYSLAKPIETWHSELARRNTNPNPVLREQINTAHQVLSDLLIAVQELQKNDLVHNDIKPENIVFDGKSWNLIDFDSLDEVGKKTPLFTANFAAHEITTGQQTHFASDLYSMGLTLSHMLLLDQAPDSILDRPRWPEMTATLLDERYRDLVRDAPDLALKLNDLKKFISLSLHPVKHYRWSQYKNFNLSAPRVLQCRMVHSLQ